MNLIIRYLFTGLLLLSCKSPTSPKDVSQTIFPLAIGNQWIMQVSYYDTLGNLTFTSQDTTRIIGDTIIQNQKYYVLFNLYLMYLINREDGLYSYDFETSQPRLWLKYPGNTGDSYSTRSTTYSIVTTDTLISLSKGSFHCYQYSIGDSGKTVNHYYSPGIGCVQDEYVFQNKSAIAIRRKLIDYILK